VRSRDPQALQFWAKLSAGILVALLLMVWEHVQALRLNRDLQEMHQEADRLTYENGRMQTQVNEWISPSHLETVARQQFQMVPVDTNHVIGIEKS
jgi:cell division protein FtsL